LVCFVWFMRETLKAISSSCRTGVDSQIVGESE